MTKWKDTTKGGHKILWREEIKEGERNGWSFGSIEEIEHRADIHCIWRIDGTEAEGYTMYNLVPAEPKVTHTRYVNVYKDSVGGDYHNNDQWPSLYNECRGRIRIDWLDNGTFTVSKEEV